MGQWDSHLRSLPVMTALMTEITVIQIFSSDCSLGIISPPFLLYLHGTWNTVHGTRYEHTSEFSLYDVQHQSTVYSYTH
eukprot:scaffold2917_cov282-Chaetoceros_neogracile.AAC.9